MAGFGGGGNAEQDSIDAIRTAIDHGVNIIDTAPMYGMGFSEKIVGKAIPGLRNKFFIATKCGCRWDTDEGSDPWIRLDQTGKEIEQILNIITT